MATGKFWAASILLKPQYMSKSKHTENTSSAFGFTTRRKASVKTIIHLTLSDEERSALAKNWNSKNKQVSRQEVTDFVNTKIQLAILAKEGAGIEQPTDAEIEAAVADEPAPDRDRSLRPFVPSRGDEPYLYKPKDPELAAACSAALDGLEHIEKYIWGALNRNRQ